LGRDLSFVLSIGQQPDYDRSGTDFDLSDCGSVENRGINPNAIA